MNLRIILLTSALLASAAAIHPAFAKSPSGFSSFGGRTVVVKGGEGGAHTVTTTVGGATTTEVHETLPQGISVPDGQGGWMKYQPKPVSDALASTTYGGKKIEVLDDGGGAHTVNTINEAGVKTSETHAPAPEGISVPDGQGGWTKYEPKPKSKVVASTHFDGKTIEVTDNGDGTRTVTTTDEEGHVTTAVR